MLPSSHFIQKKLFKSQENYTLQKIHLENKSVLLLSRTGIFLKIQEL